MTAALLLALFAALTALLIAWSRRRHRVHPYAWGLVDAAAALVGLVLGSTLASAAFVSAWVGGWPENPADMPLLPALLGTAAGSLAAAGIIRARADWAALGLVRPPPRWVRPVLGCLALFLSLSSLWALLLASFELDQEQQLVAFIRENWPSASALAVVLYGVGIAPAVEELLFRGFLLPPLARRVGAPVAVVATAALFGVMHLNDPPAVPPLVLLGAMCGWLRLATGSLWPPLALHLANNTVAIGMLFLGV